VKKSLTPIVENPEIGCTYLVRYSIGGSSKNRFRPAKVLRKDKKVEGDIHWDLLTVAWIYEGTEDEVPNVFGAVRQITPKWVRDEKVNLLRELAVATKKLEINAAFEKSF
jgi:hypothetical protein